MLGKLRSPKGLLRPPSLQRAGVRPLFPVLCLVSLALLALSRIDHHIVHDLRWRATEAMTPALKALSVPVEPLRWAKHRVTDISQLSEEVTRLRAENLKLKGYEWRAKELSRKLDQLQPLARMVAETPYNFVTTRVMSNSSGAFVRSVLVDVGRKQNLRPGYPVVNELGLVGRVVDAGDSAARILLLTDLNSRVPVRIGEQGLRAILVGDNGGRPRLDFIAVNADIKAGDEVATSGAGGLFPQGLRVGRLVRDRRGMRVELSANLDQLEYVSVLFYNGPTLEMTDKSAKRKDARLVGQKKFKIDSKR